MTDEQLIRAKAASMKLMFQAPTRELFESLFTTDCDYVTFMGQHLRGIDENLKVHQQLAGTWFFRGAELVSEIKQVKFMRPDVAVVIAEGAIKFRWQKSVKRDRLSINTNVFVKQDGDWKLASFQNTRIQRPGLMQRLFMKKDK
ncbi:SgcJ/EcaC family oxidoreductase [Chitinophaga sp. CB10]|uniref:SgcJ/EcaC family oxidoreductase n=1 Tax=Chitinophaga sp. CB10 TaxID=1891659 RepID=UPI0025BE1E42|nr:SgcJ/EcaC family oxidoreductase [Chitinophaga sp. CB10]